MDPTAVFLLLPPTSIEVKLGFLLLRGWLLLLVLLPVCLTLTRQPLELWIVLALLLFVVAEFTPAFVYFQQVPPTLFDQVSGGLIRQAIFVALIAGAGTWNHSLKKSRSKTCNPATDRYNPLLLQFCTETTLVSCA